MISKKKYTFVALLVILSFVSGEFKVKESITFVIDDTESMAPEIGQVKARTDDIFEAVLTSNASQIDEFIIVTFNDPDAIVRVKTNRRGKFKRALRRIQAEGGDDCPEMAMTGIKLALDESKPHSFLYAFTDASAKDYRKYENVKSLALEKSIQINFLLTGKCDDSIEELHTVYDRLAAATSGQVFHIGKLEISKIIKYILANLRSLRTILLHKTYGYRCDNYKFTVDSKVWDVLIALSASRPLYYDDLIVLGPDGMKASISGFINSENTIIVKLEGNPGEYSIDIIDCEEITVVISAATSVSFRHGFSSVKPNSLDETSTKPLLGKKSYLAIALENDERDVTLKNLEIRDMDDKLVQQLSLKLIDEENQFYITDLFTPPEKAYKLAITGYTKSNEKITRVSETSIEYHRPEKIANVPAKVTVIGSKEVVAEYNESVMLKCKVNGLPRPKILWLDEFHNDLPAEVNEISPHEYISILHIDKVTMNVTFTCVAENFVKSSDYVSVIVEKSSFFDVLEHPKDVTVEYGEPVELNFKVNAKPPATIIWYQDDKIIRNNEDITISSDSSSLNIKSAKPSLEGEYYVTASNGHDKAKYEFRITVMMKEKPAKVTTSDKVFAQYNQPLMLTCKVEGYPEPSITWEDEYHNVMASTVTEKTPPYEFLNTLQIDKVMDSATYICKAKNKFNEDSGSVNVIIQNKRFFNVLEYPKDVSVEYGKSVELNFKIDAFPSPTIIWYQDDKEIQNNHDFHISADGSLLKIKNAQPVLERKYYVKATNGDEKAEYDFHITVIGTEIPKIDKRVNSYKKLRKSSVDIKCRVIQGTPEPKISWSIDHGSLRKFRNLKETAETIRIEHVTENHVGTYRCDVSNVVGSDRHEMQLYIEYPPTVSLEPSTKLKSVKGKQVKLACRVDGSPTPNVRWLVDELEIHSGRKYKMFPDHTLSFTGAITDSGSYSCEASNYLETVRAKVSVLIYDPIKIETPKQSAFDAKLRSELVLPCHVTGYPKPKVGWLHYPNGLTSAPKTIKFDEDNNVILKNIQLEDGGFYRCTAVNSIGKDDITYEVNVPVPAVIIPDFSLVTNNVQLVEGDLYFALSCITEGSPKPTVTWTINGMKVGGGGGFQILSDGTLTVSYVTLRHKGTYSCKAQNVHGSDSMEYEVNVHKFPPTIENPSTILITEGKKNHNIYCGMKAREGFIVRWFKDGEFIKIGGDMTLLDVTKADAGYYTCRLSKPQGASFSFHYRAIVGTKPKFISDANSTVTFEAGAKAHLDCSATGEPPPRTKWWYDNNQINVDTPQYTFTMNTYNIGQYMCSVSNELGSIKRYFDIIAGECLMDLEKDFTALQPLLITGKRKRQCPIFNISGGSLRMQKLRKFTLVCPDSFISYNYHNYGSSLVTSCVGDSMFDLGGRTAKASEITCDKAITPLAKNISDHKCLGRNTQLLHIGFDIDGSFVTVFRVCFNETTKTPVFVKRGMHRGIANTIPENVAKYTRGTRLSCEFEEIYDCRNQMDAISSFTGKSLKSVEDEKCCFKKRQLVNPKDVVPGVSQVATYHYLNVVPQWSTCGTENWDEVERRIRLYAIKEGTISIWTGATSVINNVAPITLKDKSNQKLQVPQFIWKVVEHQLAIIHINVPGLTSTQASSYILCRDICETVDWMSNSQWHDVDKGFIYCCTIKDFERAFDYQDVFVN